MTISEACWFSRTAPPVSRWKRSKEGSGAKGEEMGEDEGGGQREKNEKRREKKRG